MPSMISAASFRRPACATMRSCDSPSEVSLVYAIAPVTIDRAMTAPKALASLALTVNRMFSPLPALSALESVEDAFHVRNDDKLVTPLGDEADELRLPVHADPRC